MALDIEKARAAGYSDAEIVDFLGKDSTLDIGKARKAGYKDSELIQHFTAPPAAAPATPVVPPPAQKQVAGPEEGDFMRGLGNLPGQFQETYGGAKTLAGVLLKSKDLIQGGLESMEEGKFKQTSKESDSFTEAWKAGIGTVLTDWLPYQIGSGVGSIAETGAFMLMGAGAGAITGAGVGALPGALAGAVSKSLVKQGIKEAAEKIAKESGKEAAQKYVEAQAKKVLVSAGTTAGMVSQAGMSGAGEVTGRAVEEAQKAGKTAEDIDLGRVVPAAIAHGVADFLINKTGINALKIGEKGLNNLALDIATRIAVTGAKQTPAELIQTAAERYGAKLSLDDAEALKEYVDTAAAAFGMSVAPGGVGGARTNLSQKFARAAKEDTTPEDQLRLESTSAAGMVQAPPPPPSADLVAGLTPSMLGNVPLAKVSSDTAEAQTKVNEEAAQVQLTKDQVVQKAQDYVAGIEAGGKVDRDEVNTLVKELNFDRPKNWGIMSNVAKLDLIKQHLAQQGAPSATTTGTDTSAAGAGAAVAGEPDTGTSAVGAVPPVAGGMVSPTAIAESDTGGKGIQPIALSPVAQKIIAEEYAAGATPAELATKYASSPGVAASIDTFVKSLPPQGIPSGTATSQAKQTKAQGQAPATGTAATPKKLTDLSPEGQAEVARRQALIAEIERDGRDATEEKNYLNKFLAKQGVTGTLPARSETKSIKKDFLEEGELPYAVEGEETTGVAQDRERVQAYKESLTDEKGKPKTIPDYDISEGDQQLYNEMRDEVNPQVKAANETRKELAAAYEAALEKYNQAPEDQENAAFEALNAAEDALQEHGPTQRELPEYSKKFAADYKDIYFGNITAGPLVDGKRAFGSSRR